MKKITKSIKPIRIICIALFMLASTAIYATHFRYGTVNWQVISSTSTTRTVQFTHTQSWRKSFFFSQFGSAIGQTFRPGDFYFGDGNRTRLTFVVTSENNAENWVVGTATVTYTYNRTTDVTAYINGCCRISSLLEGQNDDQYRIYTNVSLSDPSNSSPVANTQPILYVQTGLSAATIQLNATDPENDPLTYTLASSFLSGLTPAVPSVVSSLNPTGLLSINTTGKSIGSKYAVQAIVSDGSATVPLDFIIQVVGVSTPPQFDYSITPTNSSTIKVQPGNPINFDVNAFDVDPNSIVTLNSSGLPSGAIASVPGGISNPGNPAQLNFSWTPGIADLGSYAISFSATDNILVQTITNVNIVVSLAPVFDVGPTPDPAIHNVVEPGTNISFTVQATDPDPLDVCSINAINGKNMAGNKIPIYPGVTMTPSLPTSPANTTSSVFSWTPTPSQWGHRHVFFTAEDAFGDKTDHEVSILVNTTPQFTSSPVNDVVVLQDYEYNITTLDPDVAFGDVLQIKTIGAGFPAWLALVDNGDGTATLSGTPTIADAGTYNITLQLEDINHHLNDGGIPTQSFSITVIPCLITPSSTVSDEGCPGAADGSIDLSLDGNFETPSFSWSGPNNFSASTEDISGLAPGTYSVTVDSSLGCSETATYTVNTTPDNTPPVLLTQDATLNLVNGLVNVTESDVIKDSEWIGYINTFDPVTNQIINFEVTQLPDLTSTVDENAGTLTLEPNYLLAYDNQIVQSSTYVEETQLVDQFFNFTGNVLSNTLVPGYDNYAFIRLFNSNFGLLYETRDPLVEGESFEVVYDFTPANTVYVQYGFTVEGLNASSSQPGSLGNVVVDASKKLEDNCSATSIVISPNSFDCSQIGLNTVNITVSDTNGNSRSGTAVVDVVGEIPSCSIVSVPTSNVFTGSGPNNLFLGYGADSTVLTSSVNGGSEFTYSWSGDVAFLSEDDVASPEFTPNSEGSYSFTLTATNEYGCSSTCDITIEVLDVRCGKKNNKVLVCHNGNNICISPNAVPAHLSNHSGDFLGACFDNAMGRGINEGSFKTLTDGESAFTIYPNPSSGLVNVEFDLNARTEMTLEVLSISGQIVYSENVSKEEGAHDHRMDLSSLSGGIYIVRISSENDIYVKRLIIK